ncbi:transcription intermediary factor 1-alpha-like [Notolabrus celidotus]|uniref:transcription intermediary factor 1-alpha-like n=1 Tax=Notolabrus celidotus TaxID=1203425 RepID=UPI00148F90A5|nr:transcription intermediary factor 1-alpha-like [Notolabrus celidotus]XP_034542170.1 transcription intermediary factor 1-alpha-like [Notolabrus celidotus]
MEQMEGRTGEQDSADAAAVIIVENEAESMQVHSEGKSDTTEQNDLDTCPVCCLNFHSREPKLLPCLHSFCKKCLPLPSRNLAMTEAPNSQVDSRATKPLNVIRCPVCRQECMEVDVMENVFVKDWVEAPSSTVERTVQLCMTCDDNTEAAGFCVNCVEYLCATCVEAHQRVKFTRDHTIRQKAGATQEVPGGSTLRPMFCDVHKQEPLKLFCETCDLLTCRDCQLAKHKDHNYQFLEDAYNNHKQHMESLTQQLQEKKKLIEEVSNSINNGLLQVDQNRSSVHNEIKKSICTLILEINKKGKMLLNQLEAVTKDHESVLRKQQEDISYLSRHLDHVIKFTKWATARSGGTALLYCKRLILFQIGNLLRAKCSTSFIPQSTARFQCRAAYWASNVDLGSLVMESVPGPQLGGCQGIPHHLSHPGQAPSGSPQSFAPGAPHNTLAQLQMQVDKLNPQVHWQPQPPPPPWTWYQSVRLQRTIPGTLHGGSPSHSIQPQTGRRFMVPAPNHVSPTSSLPSPGFTPQPLGMTGSSPSYQPKPVDVLSSSPLYSHITPVPISGGVSSSQSRHTIEPAYLNRTNESGGPMCMLKTNYPQSLLPTLPHRNVQGQQYSPGYAAVSQEEKPGSVSWKPPETHQASGAVGSAAKRRRRSSVGPIIVIKDEPDDDSSYVLPNQRASLPDSTGDQPHTCAQGEPNKILTPLQSTDDKRHRPNSLRDQSKTNALNPIPLLGGEQQADQHQAPLEASNEAVCAVCRTGGELLRCKKCLKEFHLSCHVPALLKSPSGDWLCSLCRDLLVPGMEYGSKPEAKTVKTEPDSEGGLSPVDKLKCEKLLLLLFCSDLSPSFKKPASPPSLCANDRLTIRGPVKLCTVKKRLEAKQSVCYHSPAEFVLDIRLVLGNCTSEEADTEVFKAGVKLKDLFEEHLKTTFPDQTFPEIKLEMSPAAPPHSQLSFLHNVSPPAKRQRTCSDSQDTLSCPSGEQGVV